MNILITEACWGRAYTETFCDYSLASLLSPGNLPALASAHQVSFHIVAPRDDAARMRGHHNVQALNRHCTVEWDAIEDHGFDASCIPSEHDGDKYQFLRLLQNLAFSRARDFDAMVFTYADFVWSDGSLPHAVGMLASDVEAVLTFCPPLEAAAGKSALDRYRSAEDGTPSIRLGGREGAAIVIDHLHGQARRHYWDAPDFTSYPTYLIWPVEPEGLIVRAYHQTVLALKVRPDSPDFFEGLPRGSLDGYYTAMLAERGRVAVAADSDDVLVLSLFESRDRPGADAPGARERALRQCLQSVIGKAQRRLARTPIRVKRTFTGRRAWAAAERASWFQLEKLHRATEFDAEAYEAHYRLGDGFARRQIIWRRCEGDGFARRLYKRIASRWRGGATAEMLTRLLGAKKARKLRSKIEDWLF